MVKNITPQVIVAVSEEGDWEGIYVDGELRAEGHSVDPYEVIKALGFTHTRVQVPTEWFEATGNSRLPFDAKELPGDPSC